MRVSAAFATMVILASAALSQSQPKTVTEYFMAFPPSDYATNAEGAELRNADEIAKFRRSLIKTEDIRNGYLRLEGGWKGWGEFALFKRTDGTYVIARSKVECGPACTGTLAFHEYKDGEWSDISSDVFDAPDNDDVAAAMRRARLGDASGNLFYSLPRSGTEITLNCSLCRNNRDAILLRYAWRSPKFVRK